MISICRNNPASNPDGSMTLLFQSESPGKDREANWLPTPKSNFILMLRMHWPKPENPSILDGNRKPSPVERISRPLIRSSAGLSALWHGIGHLPRGPLITCGLAVPPDSGRILIMRGRLLGLLVGLVLAACTTEPPVNPASGLIGISKAAFLRCSGPPQLSETQGNQERMTFLTNETAGAGLVEPAAAPVLGACSGNAVFRDGRLRSVTFGGNEAICIHVFGPCEGAP